MSEVEDMSPEAIAERRSRWLSVGVDSRAMPTRTQNSQEWDRMKRWEKEHDAARTLAKAGKEITTLAEAPAQLKALGG
jgi:hypothetical protein